MRKERYQIYNFVCLVWLLTIIFTSSVCALASRPVPTNIDEVVLETPEYLSAQARVINNASVLISRGDFDSAADLIKEEFGDDPEMLGSEPSRLLQIVNDYSVINRQRQEVRDKAYSERIAKLDEYRELSETNDPNEPNDLTVVFSAIADITELANEQQQQEVLSNPYVKQIIQESIDQAARYEVEGKWIEAYTNCYYWLAAIDPNNEGYKEHAEKVYEKALIAASLEDSPCETRQERYEGVEKELFFRAIAYLDQDYVSELDYDLMTEKAINQCKLLGEVMEFPPEDFNEPQIFTGDYKQSLSAWSESLDTLLEETKKLPEGVYFEIFLDILNKVLLLNKATVNLPENLLIAQFSEAALSSLDPYTVIVWPRQLEDFEKLLTKEFSGIGVEISKPAGLLTIASLLPDTPAYKVGLDAGDVIEAVDGIETKDMTLTCAVRKITGPKGTKVKLTIRSPGAEETRDVVITRGIIVVQTIRGWQRTEAGQWNYMVDEENKIGYIRLTDFVADSAADLEKALDDLEDQGMKGLILDLRFNSGGLLDSALDVSDKFIEEGLIVRRVPRPGGRTVFSPAQNKGTHPNYPLVILINPNSASASEIVAGALADDAHERAILVGERTHGKGSVQGIRNISTRAQLKFTMAYYHLPSGQRVESRDAMEKKGRKDWGVGPDVEVKLFSDELRDMIEVQRDNDVLFQENHEDVNGEVKKHTIEETLAVDRQLAVGLLVIKSKLVQDNVLAKAQSGS